MNLGRCPICHSRISLEACVQDEAGRELLGLLARLDSPLAMPLVSYLGLFRAENRDLANDRALRLMTEVLALGEPGALAPALVQTVESLRAKGGLPLKNHNYLKRVIESLPAEHGALAPRPRSEANRPMSRTESAVLGFLGHEQP